MMKRRYKPAKRYKKRRRSLQASNAGPILALFGTIMGVLAIIALVVYVVLPYTLPLVGVTYRAPLLPTPTPAPTARPTATPIPLSTANLDAVQTEIVLSGYDDYHWFGDPYYYNGKIMFTAGKLTDGNVFMKKLISYDTATKQGEDISYTLNNEHFMFPVFNDKWLVYLDAKATGGGYIMACDQTSKGAKPFIVKEIYTGQPEIMLDGNDIAWTERTGTRMDKLFVCDLTTLESTTLEMFNNSYYGQSKPSFSSGALVWASTDSKSNDTNNITSAINYIKLNDSVISSYSPGTYVHDPKFNGLYFAWLDGNHNPEASLYIAMGTKCKKIDSGVADFDMCKDFIAYGKDEAVWIYSFADQKTYRLTPERERTQFLNASNGVVMWMDVTSREKDIIKYSVISERKAATDG